MMSSREGNRRIIHCDNFVRWVVGFCSVFIACGLVVHGFVCHGDSTYEAEPGLLRDVQFTWLAGLQYIHIKTGHPHYYRVPRVVLVSRQFALSTAKDAANVPSEYALGNIIFGDYERDEAECGITRFDYANGKICELTSLMMPIADVLVHPEYKHFSVENSIALLKMVDELLSEYMLPICLPYSDYTSQEHSWRYLGDGYFHMDFTSEIPRNFEIETKAITLIRVFPNDICHVQTGLVEKNFSDARFGCSDGCGFYSGAPTFVQDNTGHWTLVAIAHGGPPCEDPMYPKQRSRVTFVPAMHTLLFPYLGWINLAITKRKVQDMTLNDPFGLVERRSYVGLQDTREKGWVGKWWIGGLACYDRGEYAKMHFRFYHETFRLIPSEKIGMNYYIDLSAPANVRIICIKVGIPYRLGDPRVYGLNTYSAKIRLKLYSFVMEYTFEIEAWGHNTTT